ncbi:MAG: sporulation integral membrane protein YtvI [Firmicutes bacterium]|nr:sporulation integral membrane protein YtvI [Bacillota bacterium]
MQRWYQWALLGLGILAATIVALKYILPYVLPFVLGALFAIVIDPAVGFLSRRHRWRRDVAVFFVLTMILLLLFGFAVVGTAGLIYELNQLVDWLASLSRHAGQLYAYWQQRLGAWHQYIPDYVWRALQSNESRLYAAAADMANTLVKAVQQLPATFVTVFISLMATYFISRDRDLLGQTLVRLGPKAYRSRIQEIQRDVGRAVFGFIRAQLILIAVSTVISISGLLLLRVKYAWLLGLLAGAFDLVPMIGPSGVFIPLILYHLLIREFPLALGIGAVLAVVLLVRQVTEPQIVGRNIGLHPLTSLVAVYVGFKLFSVNGFIIGPLTAVVLKAVVAGLILPRLEGREGWPPR